MKSTTVISMLENDLYKFAMSYYYQRTTPEGIGTFSFTDRNIFCVRSSRNWSLLP